MLKVYLYKRLPYKALSLVYKGFSRSVERYIGEEREADLESSDWKGADGDDDDDDDGEEG